MVIKGLVGVFIGRAEDPAEPFNATTQVAQHRDGSLYFVEVALADLPEGQTPVRERSISLVCQRLLPNVRQAGLLHTPGVKARCRVTFDFDHNYVVIRMNEFPGLVLRQH